MSENSPRDHVVQALIDGHEADQPAFALMAVEIEHSPIEQERSAAREVAIERKNAGFRRLTAETERRIRELRERFGDLL